MGKFVWLAGKGHKMSAFRTRGIQNNFQRLACFSQRMKAIFAIENAVSCVSLRKSANRFRFHGTATGWLRFVHGLLGALVLSFAASGAAQAQNPTLTVSSVEPTTATLTIANHIELWSYERTAPSGGTCKSIAAGTDSDPLSNLSGNNSYTYRAYKSDDCSTGTNNGDVLDAVTFVTKPSEPDAPTVSQNGGGMLQLTAALVAADGSEPLDSWMVQRKKTTESNWIIVTLNSENSRTLQYDFSNLDKNGSYEFQVQAVNSDNLGSGWSASSTAVTPADVTLVVSDIEVSTAKLTIDNWPNDWWYKNANGACSSMVSADTTGTATIDLPNNPLSGNTNYTYTAYSKTGCMTSDTLAGTGEFLTKPGSPTIDVETGVGNGKLELTFSLPIDNGTVPLSEWEYAKRISGTIPWDQSESVGPAAPTLLKQTVSDLTNDTPYEFRVRAVNSDGLESVWSAPSPAVAPLDETLAASDKETKTATLTIGNWPYNWWYKQTEPSSTGTCDQNDPNAENPLKVELTGLSGNTKYTYIAYSDSVCSDTEELQIVEFLTKPGKPGAPGVEVGKDGGTVILSSSVSGDGEITEWHYAKGADGSFGDWIIITESNSVDLKYSVANLDNYQNYQFRVRAVNATGEGLSSDDSAAIVRADGKLTGANAARDAWLAPFGRTIAVQTVDTLSQRFATPPDTQFILGGESIPMTAAGKDVIHEWADGMSFSNRNNEVRAMTDDDFVIGSSFHITQAGDEGPEGRWSIWGRASVNRMEDSDEGFAVSGEVATGVFGADWERGRWLAGLALTRSKGEGDIRENSGSKRIYQSESTMMTVSPYLRLKLSEGMLVWGLAGTGSGDLTFEEKVPNGEPIVYDTDLGMTLAAAGMQRELMTPEETGGYRLTLKGDAFWVRIKSDAMVSEEGKLLLSAASVDSSRLRLALEGSRPFLLEDGATLTPVVEVAVRHDEGDAETGAGLDIGGGIAYSGPGSRLRVDLRAQTLLLHADKNRREWGLSGSFRLLPDDKGRGLMASVAHGRGADIGGSNRLWNAAAATELLVGDNPSSDRLETEVGYGLSAFGGRLTQTPYLGYEDDDGSRNFRLGWRLTAPTGLFEASLEAVRRLEASGSSNNGIDLVATSRW